VPKLEMRPLVARIAGGYRHNWRLQLVAGIVVFVPIGLINAFDPLDGNLLEDWSGGWAALLALVLVGQAAIPLLGAVFYSGVVAAGEEERTSGTRRGLSEVARTLPYWTLIVADLALVVILIVGFIALIVPGIIFLTWFALIAPVIEMEGLSARAAFRRSRELVRPHVWRVAGVIIPLTILQSVLEGAGQGVGHGLLGDTFLGNWAGSTVANLLGSPLYALTVLALYFEITARAPRAARDCPRRTAGNAGRGRCRPISAGRHPGSGERRRRL
jgi:hypothetical protein